MTAFKATADVLTRCVASILYGFVFYGVLMDRTSGADESPTIHLARIGAPTRHYQLPVMKIRLALQKRSNVLMGHASLSLASDGIRIFLDGKEKEAASVNSVVHIPFIQS